MALSKDDADTLANTLVSWWVFSDATESDFWSLLEELDKAPIKNKSWLASWPLVRARIATKLERLT